MCQTQQLINSAGPSRVPVPENIDSSSIIHGAMDNFDHEENISSGVGGSHDTMLVLFQKSDEIETNEEISHKPAEIVALSPNKRSLSHVLNCQKLIKRGKFSNRANIPVDFRPSKAPNLDEVKEPTSPNVADCKISKQKRRSSKYADLFGYEQPFTKPTDHQNKGSFHPHHTICCNGV